MGKSNDDYVRERATLAGLNLTDADVKIIREKWERTSLCSLDDLLSGIRNLRDISLPREKLLQLFNQPVLNSARNEPTTP